MKNPIFMLGILITVNLISSSCSSSSPSVDSNMASTGNTGTITRGVSVSSVTTSINRGGGTIVVTDPASPLAGMKITVPPDSFEDPVRFDVSSAPIDEHSFGEDFNPITPLITIDNGGGYSEELLEVTIPVTVPEGHFAMGFLYDEETGQLEGLPLISQDDSSITVTTRHFSSFATLNRTSPRA